MDVRDSNGNILNEGEIERKVEKTVMVLKAEFLEKV